ncbi:hypothetical protein FPOAC2_04507 [Fusarium poae]|jgi:hypothetical protein|uniref:hypothetical protein n=1 Tax=Fusarium poae TaxID=36050 RepID=UPI001CE7884B|nr:hypothetical protein FPOAC1_004423 [Fusarium poae]KAG8671184.1 hypothetical protein FPOAC1_004423 [Fusarium poae]
MTSLSIWDTLPNWPQLLKACRDAGHSPLLHEAACRNPVEAELQLCLALDLVLHLIPIPHKRCDIDASQMVLESWCAPTLLLEISFLLSLQIGFEQNFIATRLESNYKTQKSPVSVFIVTTSPCRDWQRGCWRSTTCWPPTDNIMGFNASGFNVYGQESIGVADILAGT